MTYLELLDKINHGDYPDRVMYENIVYEFDGKDYVLFHGSKKLNKVLTDTYTDMDLVTMDIITACKVTISKRAYDSIISMVNSVADSDNKLPDIIQVISINDKNDDISFWINNHYRSFKVPKGLFYNLTYNVVYDFKNIEARD